VPRIVVPFRGPDAKRRLTSISPAARRALAHAMLSDVLATSTTVGQTLLVTPPDALQARSLAAHAGVEVIDDPGRGQGEAVASALRTLDDGPVLVVNADLPCAQPADLLALLGLLPPGGLALVEAADGTTNALALASPRLFERLYGADSAARFRRHAEGRDVPWVDAKLPGLALDVDRLADLGALDGRLGPATAAARQGLLAAA
jgi:2-phospho-L-lactate/phosphoenolpyruvate guanylyltransferase